MSVVVSVLGIALVLLTLADQFRTVLAMTTGPGVITRSTTRLMTALGRHRLVADNPLTRALGGWGVVIIAVTLSAWIVLAFLGWSLVFVSTPDAVITSTGHSPASVADRLYFVGYSMTTLGNGAYRPGSTAFEVATVAATLSGMLLITLAISYLASLIGAVVGKRSFASQVHALGESPVDAVSALTSSGGAGTSVTMLGGLCNQLTTLSQQHRAYPLLHAFHPRQPTFSTNGAVALLLDVVTLASSLDDRSSRTPVALLRSARSSAEGFLHAAPPIPTSVDRTPPVPSDQHLADAAIGVDHAELRRRFAEVASLRQTLLARVIDEGFSWPTEDEPNDDEPNHHQQDDHDHPSPHLTTTRSGAASTRRQS